MSWLYCSNDAITLLTSCALLCRQDGLTTVKAAVCRSTIIPPRGANAMKEVISAQPVSVGDSLIKITTDADALNMTYRMKQAGFMAPGARLTSRHCRLVFAYSYTCNCRMECILYGNTFKFHR